MLCDVSIIYSSVLIVSPLAILIHLCTLGGFDSFLLNVIAGKSHPSSCGAAGLPNASVAQV